jgi:epoxyqueuosine reductase
VRADESSPIEPPDPPVPPDPHQLAALIKAQARRLDFDLCGIAPAEPSPHAGHLRAWLDAGMAGEMTWLHRRFEERTNPARYLPGAKSVVCVALNYRVSDEPIDDRANSPASTRLKVARYALGTDYHDHVKRRLWQLADWLKSLVPTARTRCAVDTAPVLERELAARAGIGWIGKNTMLIHPTVGSYTFLGEILTTIDLPPDDPMPDRCGSCTRCIDACPTACITPYQLDASRCVSYLTIEHRSDFGSGADRSNHSSKLPSNDPSSSDVHLDRWNLDGWVYGCDICQEVCPHNRRAPISDLLDVQPIVPPTLDREQVLAWTSDDYARLTRRSAIKRVKLSQFRRNALRAVTHPE